MNKNIFYDVIILGAGAAGMMAGITAGKYGLRVLIIEKNSKIGEKIKISGGSRCNFTNIYTSPENYISSNSHFCKSALALYTPQDFISLVEKHNISYHEKKLGQLFCDQSSVDIINMLLKEGKDSGLAFLFNAKDIKINIDKTFEIQVFTNKIFKCKSLVVATGGLSLPKLGASDLGYEVGKMFGHEIIQTRPGLVPILLEPSWCKDLAGISMDVEIRGNEKIFRENILFTHRGISGPCALQISSYVRPKDIITINFAPDYDLYEVLLDYKKNKSENKKLIKNLLSGISFKQNIHTEKSKLNRKNIFPDNFLFTFEKYMSVNLSQKISEASNQDLKMISDSLNSLNIEVKNLARYEVAEVTCGGIDTRDINSKTMESKLKPHLYFIGEVLDVTGWLGGYNFQWAWSSGYACGVALGKG